MTGQRTYLDYNATAPLRPEARQAMVDALALTGNPSSVHAEGRRARSVIERARGEIARLLGARGADIILTSGATEANGTVMAGGWRTIYLSGLEHDSVRAAAKRSGAAIVHIPVAADGCIDVEAFAHLAVAPQDHALVSVQAANNETGVIQPVADIARIARASGIRVHCDAVQAAGRIPLSVAALGADFVTVSSHKLGGPAGAGALVVLGGAPLPALIVGGGQERGRRAGTEAMAAIAGFGAAAAVACDNTDKFVEIAALRDHLEEGIRAVSPDVVIVGSGSGRLANTSCIALPGASAEAFVIKLDLAGFAVSAGAACSSGKVGRSATLAAMGLPDDVQRAAIRVSIGHATTAHEITSFVATWREITRHAAARGRKAA